MKYKRLGNSGLLVSELCLGTNTFGGADSPFWANLGGLRQPDVDRIVGHAVDSGINFLDTADVYAAGESEQCVGQAIRNLGIDRADIVIATKAGGRMAPGANRLGASRTHLLRSVDDSLRRLNVDYLDLFMIHYFDPATPLEESMEALDSLVRAGKIRYLGCSNFAAWQVMKANGIAALGHLSRLEVIEANWSAATRGIEREIVPMARDQKLGILAWGPLLGGLLSGKYTRDGGGAGEGRSGGNVPPVIDRDKLFGVIEAIGTVADEVGATTAQVALAWVLRQQAITSVLFGARSVAQVDDNIGAAKVVLADEQVASIDAVGQLTMDYGPWAVRGSSSARDSYV
jgi:aryl-alcohol dehydrogenase-like predicted oxidoreductase